ncbi:MAG: Na+/H+ antiporter subunit C [Myxococcota bacterium]
MEVLLSLGVGAVAACGIYLVLRERTFSVVLGLALLSYATNLFLFSVGRVTVGAPPIANPDAGAVAYADPLPQALVLTAIVIGFAMTAFVVVLALVARQRLGSDEVDAMPPRKEPPG